MRILTGFHAVEEKIRSFSKNATQVKLEVLYAKPGPRVKKIIEQAKKVGILCREVTSGELDRLTANLPETAREHRGIIIVSSESESATDNLVDFNQFVSSTKNDDKSSLVVILDSVTDPHNVGAIMRSCDQFGADLLILPERRGAKDGEVVNRASAGAAAWLPVSVVTNLVRAAEQLKDAGYWIYGADAGGTDVTTVNLSGKVVLVMGSEGNGISRLLQEQCDTILSIPTYGKIDSLNVSVATGVLLYEIRRQNRKS